MFTMRQDLQHLPRNQLALALTVCCHVIAVVIWLRQPHPARPAAQPEIVSILIRPAVRPAQPSPSPSPPAPMPPPARVEHRLPRVLPVLPMPVESRPTDLPSSPDAPSSSAQPTERVDANATSPATPPASGFDIDLARRQARRIADDTGPREPRLGAEKETRWARLNDAIEAAHVAPTTGVQQDSYTAADGTIIYRKRIGNRTVCRRSGDTGSGGVVSTGGSNTAGWVSCPNHVEWKPEP